MKLLKKWSYLFLLAGVGILYLTYVDKWQVYAVPMLDAKNSGGDLWPRGAVAASGDNQGVITAPSCISEDPEIQGRSGSIPIEQVGKSAEGMPPESGEKGVPAENSMPVEKGDIAPAEDDTPAEAVYTTVEDGYFADALFIGDSRTVGLGEYSALKGKATFYAATGLTVYKMFSAEIVSVPGERKKITVEEALRRYSFAKIYLMLGINEMGIGTAESFLKKYQEAVDRLRELQPDAVIYLQSIVKVTAQRSAKGDSINNERIDVRNEGIAQMADNRSIFYLDVNAQLCDESGGIVQGYTFDGVHLKAKYLDIWTDYLKTHAISP